MYQGQIKIPNALYVVGIFWLPKSYDLPKKGENIKITECALSISNPILIFNLMDRAFNRYILH